MSFEISAVPAAHAAAVGPAASADPAQNAGVLYLLTLGTKQSREKVKRLLNAVAQEFGYANLAECEWGKMRAVHILAKKAKMEQEGKAPATINLLVSVLKGVAKQAWSLDQMSDHDKAVILSLKGARGSRASASEGRALEPNESSKLFGSCDIDTTHGLRDALVIALGIASGLRRTEIASIQIKDLDEEAGLIRVIGKGNKLRNIYPSETVWSLIRRWRIIRGEGGCSNLFCAIRKGDHLITAKPISGNSVYQILRRRGTAAGVRNFTPHDMRRTFATRMFESGADINIVRKALGHSSILTTQRYDKRGEEQVRNFATLIKV